MGTQLEPVSYRLTRDDLVAYAAASGDHNPIHQDQEIALAVGLPGVIAHGMLTLALAARYVDEHLGERGRIATIGAKFAKPVVVPVEGVDVVVSGTRKDDDTIVLAVTCEGVDVLRGCKVTLRGAAA
ncbi:MaoC/PaaZ C-terminal domain-containing protein [Nocardioides plantarum]|uniref:MaoC/PaaZ C-terminal domain-containing protein n=1 Tax=Nocardioides plantarum TaxID=29299 RepID=A0ABV5K814_9ACTN|nr:MaoC/PaaZ C-terminal domain-containing protein [Nocardioides plantarum]